LTPIICKNCGNEIHKIHSENFEEILDEHHIGDLVDIFTIRGIFWVPYKCEKCDYIIDLYVVIYNGLITAITDNEEHAIEALKNFNLNDIINMYKTLFYNRNRIWLNYYNLVRLLLTLKEYLEMPESKRKKLKNNPERRFKYLFKCMTENMDMTKIISNIIRKTAELEIKL